MGRSVTFQGVDFEVGADDSRLDAHIGELFRWFPATDRAPQHRIRIAHGPSGWHVVSESERSQTYLRPEACLETFVSLINRLVLDHVDGLGVHAGVVDHGSVRIVVVGESEAGKSTLTTALCLAGCAYGSDEALFYDWGSTIGQPFPKPVSLDPGSWPLFPELEPVLDVASDEYKHHQWQIPPSSVGEVTTAPATADLLVFRRYVPDAPTVVDQVSRAAAIAGLAKETHRLRDHGARALEQLEQITRDTTAIRVTGGVLDEAVAAVLAEA